MRTVGNTSRPRRRRFGLLVVAVCACLGLGAGATLLLGGGGVGQFHSVADQQRFDTAYAEAMAELPRPDKVLDVCTSYGTVRLYRFAATDSSAADRTPLLLLPGRASASPVWADNLPSLLADRPAYTVDLLGEPGMSVQRTPMSDDADQAAWLGQVLDALPEPEVHLVGMSIGGWTAANLAVHDADRIASLSLVEPVLVVDDLALEAIVRSIPASVPWLPKRYRDSFGSWTAGGAPVTDEPVARLIEAGFQTYSLGVPAPARLNLELLRGQVEGADVPVLVVLGENSPMHDTPSAAQQARDRLPAATVVVYEDASHAVNGEHPERLARDIGTITDAADSTDGG